MKKWINDIIFSFPIQLLVLHLRNHLILLGTWIFIALLMTGTIGDIYGVKYLFLTPEYLGEVNFWSFFLLGVTFGGSFITWNLTSYLLDAHHFPFLASLNRPFTKFCLNNIIVPLVFLIIYLTYTIRFQWYNEYWEASVIFYNCLGFIVGTIGVIILSAIYFRFTNKDIFSFLKIKKNKPPNLEQELAPGFRMPSRRRLAKIESIQAGLVTWRVDTYLTASLRPRLVRSVSHYDIQLLSSIFKQNHVNALIVQLFSLVLLITLGYLIDNPYFRIPAGASIFLMVSILISITGAITYWFNQWRIPAILLILFCVNYLTSYDIFNHKNKGYGMNYEDELASYTYGNLDSLCLPDIVEKDKNNTVSILNKWKTKVTTEVETKPKMVILCVSGGGMKATTWSMQVIQKADSLLQGDLLKQSVLITGASGGLVGMAYLREIYLKKQMGEAINIYDQKYIEYITKDLLNSIAFTIVANDLFLPWVEFEEGGYRYKKDRGYIFEKQLNENTNYAFDKTIGDYKIAEQEAIVPMLFVTPSIVNDGRRMIISPQGVSYMMVAPIGVERRNTMQIDAVDFGALLAKQDAQNMQFTSALRMNATYPYILPNVYLPTRPGIEVMDAGFRDNYGIMSATRFIHVFKDWIQENTSGVVLVQISSLETNEEVNASDNEGILESILNPLGIAGQILELQNYEQDTNLGFIFDLLGKDNFEVIRFTYNSGKDQERASMTFHLTQREKNNILNSFYLSENQKSLEQLITALKEE